MGRPAGARCRLRLFLPPCRASPHLLAFHGLVGVGGDLVPPDLGVQPAPDAPHLAGILAVGELVGVHRPADHRHAGGEALARGVPPVVRQEAAHGAVPQHPLLRAPRGQAPPRRRLHEELRRQQRRRVPAAVDEIFPDDPEERAARRAEAPRELGELGGGDHGQAAEVGVHDGARFLLVQPRQARGVLHPQAQLHLHAVFFFFLEVAAEEGAQRPNGVDARVLCSERGEHVGLERVEGVEHERAGLGAVVGLRVVEPEPEVVGVRRAHEAGHVAEADRRHAGDPVDDGLLEVAVRQAGLVLERQVSPLPELAEPHVAHERRRAAAPEHHAGDAELLRHLQREAHQRRRQHARHGRCRVTTIVAEARNEEVTERGGALVDGGLAQADVVVLRFAVGVEQAVRDCLDLEPLAVAATRGAGGVMHAAEAVLGDDEGDEHAVAVEQLGQLQRRVDVAGPRVRHHHGVRLRPRCHSLLALAAGQSSTVSRAYRGTRVDRI
jgi:hypothetical protein